MLNKNHKTKDSMSVSFKDRSGMYKKLSSNQKFSSIVTSYGSYIDVKDFHSKVLSTLREYASDFNFIDCIVYFDGSEVRSVLRANTSEESMLTLDLCIIYNGDELKTFDPEFLEFRTKLLNTINHYGFDYDYNIVTTSDLNNITMFNSKGDYFMLMQAREKGVVLYEREGLLE